MPVLPATEELSGTVARFIRKEGAARPFRLALIFIAGAAIGAGVHALFFKANDTLSWSLTVAGGTVILLAIVASVAEVRAEANTTDAFDDDMKRLKESAEKAREEAEARFTQFLTDRGIDVVDDVLVTQTPTLETTRRLRDLGTKVAALEAENHSLRRQLSAEASIELARAFDASARGYRLSAKRWFIGLLLSVAFLTATSLYWVFRRKIETNATPAQIAQAVVSGAVLFAVPAYLIRVTAAQFRSQQRLAVMSEAKAVILRTFTDIVSANSNPDHVGALTERVAQSVFALHDPGTGESTADQVNALSAVAAKLVDKSS
jgi:F0F1-type ATP synthase assembly protein I